jgi:hypothetical protein
VGARMHGVVSHRRFTEATGWHPRH